MRPLGQHKAIASVVSGLENREPHHLGMLVVLGHINHCDNHQTIVAAVPTSEDPIVAEIKLVPKKLSNMYCVLPVPSQWQCLSSAATHAAQMCIR